MAKLTILGMYEYDNTLFDNLELPEGIEKDLAVDQILLRSADFEALYADPRFMKFAIGRWGKTHYRTFDKWVSVLAKEYEPLWNYDRTEESRDEDRKSHTSTTTADYNESRTVNLEDKRTADLEHKRTADLTTERTDDLTDERTADLEEKTTHNTTVTTTQTVDGTNQHDVAAYDSSTLNPAWKDTSNAGANTVVTTGDETVDTTGTDTMTHTGTATTTETGTDTTTETGTDTMNHTGTDKNNTKGTLSDVVGSEANTNIHSAKMYGNIGVMSSQDLLRQELDVQRFNIYKQIADLFVDEFCIMVYV